MRGLCSVEDIKCFFTAHFNIDKTMYTARYIYLTYAYASLCHVDHGSVPGAYLTEE